MFTLRTARPKPTSPSSAIQSHRQALFPLSTARRLSSLGPRLQVGAAHDPQEHQANKIADRVMQISTADSRTGAAPLHAGGSAVDHMLRSPGQPLDQATRTFMEPRFGYDFSNVRIHTDEEAVQSAAAIRAKAYTSGMQIAFNAGQYQPQTHAGRRLLAHELAHVLQQGAGDPSGGLHRIQRAPIDTWAGTFENDVYKDISEPKTDAYGVHIHIVFSPKDPVDADKIAFVQTAQSLVSDPAAATAPEKSIQMPSYVKNPKQQETFKARMVKEQDPDILGTHIDATPDQRTPLYSMSDPAKGDNSLEGSTEGRLHYSYFGWRSSKTGTMRDATMDDYPSLHAKENESASQTFETTALAVEGPQKGAYYGSVNWGFKKESGEKKIKLLDFNLSQRTLPSANFFKAASSWNASTNTAGEASIQLLSSKINFTRSRSDLLESPGKAKTVAKLSTGTQVETLDSASHKGWVQVVVSDGPDSGSVGWLKTSLLSATAVKKR